MSATLPTRNLLARNSTRSLLILYFATSALGVVGWSVASLTDLWHWYLALAVSGVFGLIVVAYRNLPLAVSNSLFLTSTAVMMFCVSFQSYKVAAMGRWSAIAFAGYKLIALAVAFVAPIPVWSAYLVILLCAANPTLQTLLASEEIRANYSQAEPWVSVMYAMVSFFLLRHRLRTTELERKLSSLEAERRSFDHLARVFLGLRDLTNSPLQSIELTAWLLEKENLNPIDAAELLQGSISRLRELSEILKVYENEVDWSQTDHSFDPMQLVQEKLAQMKALRRP